MEEILKVAVNGGVGLVLAILVLRWQREDGKERAAACKECCERERSAREDERADKLLMVDALQRNTQALTEVVEAVRSIGGVSRVGGRLAAVGSSPSAEREREVGRG